MFKGNPNVKPKAALLKRNRHFDRTVKCSFKPLSSTRARDRKIPGNLAFTFARSLSPSIPTRARYMVLRGSWSIRMDKITFLLLSGGDVLCGKYY